MAPIEGTGFAYPSSVRTNTELYVTEARKDGGLGPIYANEAALGLSRRLGARGSVRVDGIFRRYQDFYATQRDTSTGKVTGPQGTAYDLALITNAQADAERTYKGLLVQGNYRPAARFQLYGSYTLAWTDGNLDGEDAAVGDADGKVERSLRASSYSHARLKGGKFVVRVVEDKVRVWKVE